MLMISDSQLFLIYSRFGGGFQVVVINLDSGAARTLNGATGRPSDKSAAVIDGVLYLGSGDPGQLLALDGVTSRVIGNCGDRDYYTGAVSDDGRLWLGTYPKGTLEIYDPATDTLTRVGEFDAAITAPQYVYSLVTDGRYAYAGMGQAPWYLAVIDTQTGEAQQFFRDDNLATTNVGAAADGSGLYYGKYQLIDGEPVPAQKVPALKAWYAPNNVIIDKSGFAGTGVEVNLDQAAAVTGRTPLVRWRRDGGEWQQATIEGVQTAPATIKRLLSVGDKLLAITGAYGPLAWYDPTSKTFDVIGWTQRSLYDALQVGTDIYLSGYTAVTLRWDTTQEWTLALSTTDFKTSNPRQVTAWHKYHYYQVIDVNDLLWVGINHERDSTGGELGWYDPTTEAVGRLRDPFLTWTPRGVVSVGARIVYSGNSREGEAGQLFVINSAAKEVARTYTPPTSSTSAGAIVAVSDTDLIGIEGATAYRMNIETGAVVWEKALPAAAFGMAWYDRRIATAPDGWLWFAIGKAIYKMNPADGDLVKVVADADAPLNVCFHKGEPYLYGGTTIRKVILLGL